jgi:hypothetical protein
VQEHTQDEYSQQWSLLTSLLLTSSQPAVSATALAHIRILLFSLDLLCHSPTGHQATRNGDTLRTLSNSCSPLSPVSQCGANLE